MTDGDSGVGSVAADASPFGGSSALPLSNGGIGDTYSASFTVDATSTTDGSYAITVMATDNDANVATADTNQLTLDTDTGGEAVVIEEFTVTAQSPKNPHVEIDMSWQVSGSPESVHLTLSDNTTNTNVVDEIVAASGTRRYEKKHDSGSYTATLTASSPGGTDSDSATRTVDA